MPERTQLTQEDEALRQAHNHDRRALRTRAGLRWIADYLISDYPSDPMTGDMAKRGARLYALAAHSDDRAANRLMWDVRRALPEVRRTDTRDTYAARVRLIVEGVTV
ncbi:hypothetical protein [Streptomyces zaomyceticus]|uniref:hypothetical protein n=1 Tax=Streptomyces zaomyceticus TaxID=68286 RepID=UPI0037897A2E